MILKYITTLKQIQVWQISLSSFLLQITYLQSRLCKSVPFFLSLIFTLWHSFKLTGDTLPSTSLKMSQTFPTNSSLLTAWEIPMTSKHSWREHWTKEISVSNYWPATFTVNFITFFTIIFYRKSAYVCVLYAKLCGNCTFLQNFHTMKLGEITVVLQ